MSVAAKLAEKAALKLLKKTSIYVGDVIKFWDDHGIAATRKHLGPVRLKKAQKKIDDDKAQKQLKAREEQKAKKAEEKKPPKGTKTDKSSKKKKTAAERTKRGYFGAKEQRFTKKDLAHMSPAERKEFHKLRYQQKKALKDEAFPSSGSTAGGQREEMVLPGGRIVESPSGRLKSLHEFTEDQLKSFEPGPETLEQQLKPHADPKSMIHQQMRGKELTPSQDAEFQGLIEQGWGLDRKRGGKVRQYSSGGQIGSGVGTAMRGWGAVSRRKRST